MEVRLVALRCAIVGFTGIYMRILPTDAYSIQRTCEQTANQAEGPYQNTVFRDRIRL